MGQAVLETDFTDLKKMKQGKVRDLYDLGDSILMVASDRLSAFDVVMNDPIPDKGIILTQISLYWFDMMKSLVDNHLLTSNVDEYPSVCQPYSEKLRGRSMIVKKAEPLPIECVVRGYISGSGWKSYQDDGTICGIRLDDGLKESDKLPEPIFTPSTKADIGLHDINIDFDETVQRIGRDTAEKVKQLSLDIYRKGAEAAAEKGIIIADTKFEFGLMDDQIILIDEILTPDSSRFWPKDSFRPGGPQKSFDKQFFRDYLISIDWSKQPPPPPLPDEIIAKTRSKYLEALKLITGSDYGLPA
jgi:phosphoribosylaminoimidazole-succinocarboxamide synthase